MGAEARKHLAHSQSPQEGGKHSFQLGWGAVGEGFPGRKGLKVKGDIPIVGGSKYKGLWVGRREGPVGQGSGYPVECVLRG